MHGCDQCEPAGTASWLQSSLLLHYWLPFNLPGDTTCPKAEQAVLLEFGNFDKDYVLHFSRLTILTIDQDCRP